MLLLTLRGTPTSIMAMRSACTMCRYRRDGAGSQWNGSHRAMGRDPVAHPHAMGCLANAGFSTGTPWLPLADDYTTVNVAAERDDPASMLSLVRRLIALRRASPALRVGSYQAVPSSEDDTIVFLREHAGERLLVALNLGGRALALDLRALGRGGVVLLSTYLEHPETVDLAQLHLRPDEGAIVRLD